MAHNISTEATADIRSWMERALNAERGIKVGPFHSKGEAIRQRQRIYSWRAKDRKDSQRIYTQDDPKWNTSVYDALMIDVNPDHSLSIRKVSEGNVPVEEL